MMVDTGAPPMSHGFPVGSFDWAVYPLLGLPDVPSDGSEGAYQNDPHDRGNRGGGGTKFGMTQPFYDDVRKLVLHLEHRDVVHATEEEARIGYRVLIWDDRRRQAGAVTQLAPMTGLVYFDGCVNHGGLMIGILQSYLGTRLDYWFGPNSLRTLAVRLAAIGDAAIAMAMLDRRRNVYLKDRDFPHWGHGWRNRLNHLARFAGLAWDWPA